MRKGVPKRMERTCYLLFHVIRRRLPLQRMSDFTTILNRARQGDAQAAANLFPLVYNELRHLAAFKMANEMPGQTLQPAALVHEA